MGLSLHLERTNDKGKSQSSCLGGEHTPQYYQAAIRIGMYSNRVEIGQYVLNWGILEMI